jgi:HK97 gp10 family phage protein
MTTIKLDTRELDRIATHLGTNTREVIEGLAFEVEARAKEFCPVDTGALRASIFTEILQGGDVVARVGPSMEYGPYVELGTSRMGAQPYLMPALQTIAYKLNSGQTWLELMR